MKKIDLVKHVASKVGKVQKTTSYAVSENEPGVNARLKVRELRR